MLHSHINSDGSNLFECISVITLGGTPAQWPKPRSCHDDVASFHPVAINHQMEVIQMGTAKEKQEQVKNPSGYLNLGHCSWVLPTNAS